MDLMSAATAVSSAYDLARRIQQLTTDAAVLAATNDLLNRLNDANMSVTRLIAENADLRQAKREAEDNERALKEKLRDFDRYELARLPSGAMAFKLKGELRGPTEPAHYLCANCWNHAKEKSFLQLVASRTELRCDVCKTSLEINPRNGIYTTATPVFDPSTGY